MNRIKKGDAEFVYIIFSLLVVIAITVIFICFSPEVDIQYSNNTNNTATQTTTKTYLATYQAHEIENVSLYTTTKYLHQSSKTKTVDLIDGKIPENEYKKGWFTKYKILEEEVSRKEYLEYCENIHKKQIENTRIEEPEDSYDIDFSKDDVIQYSIKNNCKYIHMQSKYDAASKTLINEENNYKLYLSEEFTVISPLILKGFKDSDALKYDSAFALYDETLSRYIKIFVLSQNGSQNHSQIANFMSDINWYDKENSDFIIDNTITVDDNNSFTYSKNYSYHKEDYKGYFIISCDSGYFVITMEIPTTVFEKFPDKNKEEVEKLVQDTYEKILEKLLVKK